MISASTMRVAAMILPVALMVTACGEKSDNKVLEGKGAPTTEKEIVVEDGLKSQPNMVIDDKGNPVLNDDGTPKVEGDKPGPDYRGKLPPRFEGAWAINAADCARGSGETRIRVGPHSVLFYESEARVIKTQNAGAITIADMEIMAEGETIKEQHKFSLSPDGSMLNYERGGEIYRYARCPL